MTHGAGSAHAVVVGASMAGLAVAKALSSVYGRVTVLDRDRVPEGVAHRSGVPQGRHAHALLPAGADALEELFPGVLDDMVADGATRADPGARGRWCVSGHRLARGPLGRDTILATRPFIEAHVRRRLQEHPAVRIRSRCDVRGLVASTDRRRVLGLRVRSPDDGDVEKTFAADLVVDCSGRRSRTPQWLEGLGYAGPQVEQLHVDLRYATRRYHLPSGALDDDVVVFVGPTPDGPRGAVMMRVEGDRWLVTLAAMGGERPPADPDAYESFAAQLPMHDLADALRQGEPLDDPAEFRYPANTRHRYERVRAMPDGLLVAGDAVCSFNPIYGQGMTVAAMEAVALRRLLGAGTAPDPRTWFSTTADIVKVPWALAVGADLGIRCIRGRRTLRIRLANAYIARFHAAAAHDSALGVLFAQVAGLVERPQRLLSPSTVTRVIRGNLRHASVSAGGAPVAIVL
ncbi:MAG TPA: FAD-dependent monooxygenase [Egibacteraceae bacterium]|nr:FAD-dependent monooxygenase [Egibacteraceae bacterium]